MSRNREEASLLIRCNSLFPLQLSANLERRLQSQQRTSANLSLRLTRLARPGLRRNIPGGALREKRGFYSENWRKIKVEAVAPSRRPCLGATEPPPVSASRGSRSRKTRPASPGRTLPSDPDTGGVYRGSACEKCRCASLHAGTGNICLCCVKSVSDPAEGSVGGLLW